jgi:PII-like signaling protein
MSNQAKLLRIYTDEAAYYGDRKVFEMVASQARDAKLAGATVLEALIGFGRSAHLHRRHVLESDRAVVIEIIDEEASLRAFVETLSDVPGIGLITLEAIEIIGGGAASAVAKDGAPAEEATTPPTKGN